MRVRIYKPAKTAMQSGMNNNKEWLLESEPAPKILDPLMGWTGSRDTMEQVQLWFHTLDEAKAYAEKEAGSTPSSCRLSGISGPRPTLTTSPTTESGAGRTERPWRRVCYSANGRP